MRKTDWQTCFWSEIKRQNEQPFQYAARDCVLSAARVADAITVDGRYESRAKEAFAWSDEREAIRLMKFGLEPLIASVLGRMRPWTTLNMGDLVLIEDDKGRECLAVHDGVGIVSPDSVGWRSIPFRCVRGGWHVE
jgi:hypothetical protein